MARGQGWAFTRAWTGVNVSLDFEAETATLEWADVGLAGTARAAVRDLWAHADLGTFTGAYTASAIAPHESRVLKIAPL